LGGAGSFLPFPPDTGNSVGVSPFQMMPGEAKILADRLYQELSKAPKPGWRKRPAAPLADLTGQWDVSLKYVVGRGDCKLALEQLLVHLAKTAKPQPKAVEIKVG